MFQRSGYQFADKNMRHSWLERRSVLLWLKSSSHAIAHSPTCRAASAMSQTQCQRNIPALMKRN